MFPGALGAEWPQRKSQKTRKMKVRGYRAFIFIVLLSVLAFPTSPRALDLGLTPSHVYSLWTNINDSLIASSRVVSGDKALPTTLATMKPGNFSGKRPADVLNRLAVYREKLNRLLRVKNLPMTKLAKTDGSAITPSDVYLNSGHVLTAQIRWLIVKTGPEQTVSQFYTRHGFSGKTPSDVFALVELANRRMDLLLNAARL